MCKQQEQQQNESKDINEMCKERDMLKITVAIHVMDQILRGQKCRS